MRETKKTGTPNSGVPEMILQGQKDSNPRHLVLETNVLPTELYPYSWRYDIPSKLHTDLRNFMPSQLFCFIFVLRKFASLSSAFLCSPKTGHLKSTALSVCLLRKPFASSICISADQSASLHLSDAPAFLRFWSSPQTISNSQLHMLPCFHLCPIYLVVFKGSYSRRREISSWGGLHA